MALSRVTFTGNGSTQTFSLTFNYLNKGHVKAFINGAESINPTFPTTSTITLATIPANGAIVLIKRATPTTPIVDFVDGSNLTEVMLDTATRQSIFIAEENKDDAASTITLDAGTNTYPAGNRRITGVANPVDAQDATNKSYVDSTLPASVASASASATSASNSANTATTKASEASTAASNAATSATNAANSATSASNSATSATSSATSATNSATSATNSATSATNSATSATASANTATTKASDAALSATNASNSATTASNQAGIATTKAGEASTSATNAASSASQAAASAAVLQVGKNKVIGGNFTSNPWQRGGSFAAVGSGVYTADRWQYQKTGTAVVTLAKAAEAPAVAQAGIFTQHSLHVNVTTAQSTFAAGDFFFHAHKIEGLNAASLGFGQAGSRFATLSFWVRSAKAGIHCVAFRNSANNRSYISEYTVNAINTFEKKVLTIPVDNSGVWLYDNGVGLEVDFTLALGTTFQTTAGTWTAGNFVGSANQVNVVDAVNNTFLIALVQLEAGSTATAFETKLQSEVLSSCQRYYEVGTLRLDGYGAANNIIGVTYGYKNTKRAIPTIVYNNVGFANAGSIATDVGTSIHGFETTITVTTTGGAAYTANFTSNAEL